MHFFLTFIYFWDRERQSMNGGGSEREGDTESETGSRLWAVSTEPNAGLELTDCKTMTWAEVGCLTDWATQVPLFVYFWERDCTSRGGAEKGRQRIRSWLCTKSSKPDVRLELTNCKIMSWAAVSRSTDRPTQAPKSRDLNGLYKDLNLNQVVEHEVTFTLECAHVNWYVICPITGVSES